MGRAKSTLPTACLGIALGGYLIRCNADPSLPEPAPSGESCAAAIGAARTLAATLPLGDYSRFFAERDLAQAVAEAGNGEFDDCLEWAARAAQEVRERYHSPQSGETLKSHASDK